MRVVHEGRTTLRSVDGVDRGIVDAVRGVRASTVPLSAFGHTSSGDAEGAACVAYAPLSLSTLSGCAEMGTGSGTADAVRVVRASAVPLSAFGHTASDDAEGATCVAYAPFSSFSSSVRAESGVGRDTVDAVRVVRASPVSLSAFDNTASDDAEVAARVALVPSSSSLFAVRAESGVGRDIVGAVRVVRASSVSLSVFGCSASDDAGTAARVVHATSSSSMLAIRAGSGIVGDTREVRVEPSVSSIIIIIIIIGYCSESGSGGPVWVVHTEPSMPSTVIPSCVCVVLVDLSSLSTTCSSSSS